MKIYLCNCGSLEILERMKEWDWGVMITGPHFRTPKDGVSYALDNGAYSAYLHNQEFDLAAFRDFLMKYLHVEEQPDFVVCPDIVAGGLASLHFSVRQRDLLPRQFLWYLAIQDGMTFEAVSPHIIGGGWAGLFIGGSTAWKLENAVDWVAFAHKHCLQAHVGAVGTPKRVDWARRIGADSVDSSTPVRILSMQKIREAQTAPLEQLMYDNLEEV